MMMPRGFAIASYLAHAQPANDSRRDLARLRLITRVLTHDPDTPEREALQIVRAELQARLAAYPVVPEVSA